LKTKIIFVVLILGLAAMISAQGWRPGPNRPRIPPAETITVSGSMVVAHGMPAIKSGEVTYLVGGISRLTGFIDGLREGAQVSIEGSAVAHPRDSNIKFLMPAKLTLGGRTIDLAPPQWGPDSARWKSQPPSPRQPHQPGRSPRRQQNL